MRPLLLDTCVALWMVADTLSEVGEALLAEARAANLPLYVSPITAWEVGTLARKGRFRSNYTPQRWFQALMGAPGVKLAELTSEVLLESSFLPDFRIGDPADRIIAATAREYGFRVMTRDRALLTYGAEGHLAVVEC